MCKAIFRLANTEYYDEAMVVAALNTLLGRGAGDDGSVVAAVKHSRWHHVEKMAKVGSHFILSSMRNVFVGFKRSSGELATRAIVSFIARIGYSFVIERLGLDMHFYSRLSCSLAGG